MSGQHPSFAALRRHAAAGSETRVNPITGDRLTLLQSVARDGAPLVFRTDLRPGAAGTPLHRHPRMDETFEVVDGELAMEIGSGGRWQILHPGDRVTVPAGTLHSFSNRTDAWVSFVSTTTRGLEFERFLVSMFALAEEGGCNAAGMPRNPLHLALLLGYADLQVPGIPPLAQRMIIGGLAAVARALGVERRLSRHWHNERMGRLA